MLTWPCAPLIVMLLMRQPGPTLNGPGFTSTSGASAIQSKSFADPPIACRVVSGCASDRQAATLGIRHSGKGTHHATGIQPPTGLYRACTARAGRRARRHHRRPGAVAGASVARLARRPGRHHCRRPRPPGAHDAGGRPLQSGNPVPGHRRGDRLRCRRRRHHRRRAPAVRRPLGAGRHPSFPPKSTSPAQPAPPPRPSTGR